MIPRTRKAIASRKTNILPSLWWIGSLLPFSDWSQDTIRSLDSAERPEKPHRYFSFVRWPCYYSQRRNYRTVACWGLHLSWNVLWNMPVGIFGSIRRPGHEKSLSSADAEERPGVIAALQSPPSCLMTSNKNPWERLGGCSPCIPRNKQEKTVYLVRILSLVRAKGESNVCFLRVLFYKREREKEPWRKGARGRERVERMVSWDTSKYCITWRCSPLV